MQQKYQPDFKLLIIFLCIFVFLVGFVPALVYDSILPDSAQNISWGNAWSWGYTEHPPLGVWFLNIMLKIFRNIELATFLSSAICLVVSLIYIYRTSKLFLSTKTAVAATMISSLSYFYFANFALQYNQNSIMLPFWVMSAFYFWLAIDNPKLSNWIFLAVVAALAVLAKYQSFLILFLEFLYLIFNYRREYNKYLLIAFIIFVVLLIPHIIWLVDFNFLPISYVMARAGSGEHSFLNLHIFNPISCFIGQPLSLLIAILVFFILNRLKAIKFFGYGKLTNYLVYLGWAPLILVTLISASAGIEIKGEWGFVLFLFTIPGLFLWLKADTKALNLTKLLIVVIVIRILVMIIFGCVNVLDKRVRRINIPGYQLAILAKKYWRTYQGDSPIKYTGGYDGIGYYLSAYLPNRPEFLSNFSLKKSPWVNPKSFHKYGAILIYQGCPKSLPLLLQASKLKVTNIRCYSLPAANKLHKVMVDFTLAIVPPADSNKDIGFVKDS